MSTILTNFDFLEAFLLGLLLGFPVYTVILVRLGWASPNRYRYICPNEYCGFEVGSNDKDLTNRIAADHEEKFHERH